MENLFVYSDVELIIAGVLSGLFLIHLLFLFVVYFRPYRKSKSKVQNIGQGVQPPVSIILYAKNESENLQKNLPLLLKQDYPAYEVIVINDGSTDESEEVLKLLKGQYGNLYHTYIPEEAKYLSRRKLALTVGIKAAKYDVLLFTEADCSPVTCNWVRSMASNFVEGKSITLGYCSYGPYKGFLHRLIAYDNLLSGLQYISSAIAGSPYMGSGCNLAYRKEEFFKHKGYYKSLTLHAGDDDLFVNEIATKKNVQVEYSPDSLTEMGRVSRFSVWKEMKVSRAATQRYYKGWGVAKYRFDAFVFFLFLITLGVAIYAGIAGNILLAAFGAFLYLALLISKIVVFYKSARMLHQKPALFLFPFLEVISPLFNLYVRIYRSFRGKNDYTFHIP